MNILVVGCGRVGGELAIRLRKRGSRVTVLEADPANFANLPPDFDGHLVEGDALNVDVLKRAGIEHMHAVAAVSNSDSLNAVVAHVARTVYHIPNVVVRNYMPHWRGLEQAFGLQVISPSSWGAQRIEEMLCHATIGTIFSAGNGEVELYEMVVPEVLAGRKLRELLPESGCIPTSLTRAGEARLPDPEMILLAGDLFHFSATFQGSEDLRKRLVMLQEGK